MLQFPNQPQTLIFLQLKKIRALRFSEAPKTAPNLVIPFSVSSLNHQDTAVFQGFPTQPQALTFLQYKIQMLQNSKVFGSASNPDISSIKPSKHCSFPGFLNQPQALMFLQCKIQMLRYPETSKPAPGPADSTDTSSTNRQSTAIFQDSQTSPKSWRSRQHFFNQPSERCNFPRFPSRPHTPEISSV